MRTIDLPPYAPVLMESTRAIGYSLEAAIADIIDNSIAAKATRVEIDFFPVGDSYISVFDNGIGMDEIAITTAMQYGSYNPLDDRDEFDLGRFGLGLKTASLSQCRKLTVVSCRNGELHGRRWDLDHVISTKKWSLIVLDEDEMESISQVHKLIEIGHGSIVLWQELDRMKAGDHGFGENIGLRMDRVREHLSLVFHRYLSGELGLKKVEIEINRLPVEPLDPFLLKKSTQIMDDETISIQGNKVIIRPYILPHISKLTGDEIRSLGGKDGLRKLQGFYVYRNRRLLVWGTWFRMMRQGDLSKLARVRVDIPNSMDHLWRLDIKKSNATPPEIVRRSLSSVIEKIALSSKRTWTFRSKKETDDSKIHLWNRNKTREESIVYEVNRDYPLVHMLRSSISADKVRMLDHLLVQIERNLPLNSLYIDLTHDEKFHNDTDTAKSELKPLLEQLLSGCRTGQERRELAAKLGAIEPFDQYLQWLEDMLQGVENNGQN